VMVLQVVLFYTQCPYKKHSLTSCVYSFGGNEPNNGEKFEDTKAIIRNCKSMNIQHN
jgi:hypothetical protein